MRDNFNKIIHSTKPVLVNFYTEWCQTCQVQVPILKEIVQDLGNRIKVIKIDIDKNSSVAIRYGVGNLPTLMLFKNGKLRWRKDGVTPKVGLIEVIFANS